MDIVHLYQLFTTGTVRLRYIHALVHSVRCDRVVISPTVCVYTAAVVCLCIILG